MKNKLIQEMLDLINSANYSSATGSPSSQTVTIGWTNQNKIGTKKNKGDRLKELARLIPQTNS